MIKGTTSSNTLPHIPIPIPIPRFGGSVYLLEVDLPRFGGQVSTIDQVI